MKSSLTQGALAVLIAAMAVPAAAQTPQRTSATYGNWTVRCEAGSDAKRACEMIQSITVQGQAQPIAQVAFGPKAEDSYRLVVQLPIAVWLPADVKISADDAEITTAEYKRCFPQFCLAETEMTAALLDELSGRSGQGAVAFQDASQRNISVPLSFDGIADAYGALKAEMAKDVASDGSSAQ